MPKRKGLLAQEVLISETEPALPVAHADALSHVAADGFALGLGEGTQAGEDHLAVHIRGVNVFFLKDDRNAPAFEDPHVLDAVQGVTGKAGNGFRQDEVDFLLPAQFNHFVKLISFLGADA